MRALVLAVLLAVAGGAAAQNSHCAGLAQSAQVEVRGPDNVIPAQLTPRGFSCPRGFTTETVGPVTRCRQPGQMRIETREPRRDCYAALPLGPVRSVTTQSRPATACPGTQTIDNVVAVRGRNAGWQDVTLTAPATAGVTVTHLRAGTGRGPAEDPGRQDCFPHDCRLVRLTTRATTPARVELMLATPGNAASTAVSVSTEAICPAR
jgi:hypothetical protein